VAEVTGVTGFGPPSAKTGRGECPRLLLELCLLPSENPVTPSPPSLRKKKVVGKDGGSGLETGGDTSAE
jgi:hypothetical protein